MKHITSALEVYTHKGSSLYLDNTDQYIAKGAKQQPVKGHKTLVVRLRAYHGTVWKNILANLLATVNLQP